MLYADRTMGQLASIVAVNRSRKYPVAQST